MIKTRPAQILKGKELYKCYFSINVFHLLNYFENNQIDIDSVLYFTVLLRTA